MPEGDNRIGENQRINQFPDAALLIAVARGRAILGLGCLSEGAILLTQGELDTPEPVKPMAKREDRMLPKHTRASVAHHAFNLVTSLALIAMHRTFGTIGLPRSKPATFQTQRRVFEQSKAFVTKRTGSRVLSMAVALDHCGNGGPFALQPARSEPGAKCRQWFEDLQGLLAGFIHNKFAICLHTPTLLDRTEAALTPVKVLEGKRGGKS